MTGSYHVIARYDELSYSGRARCTNDIRQRHRRDLQNSRTETRLIQRLKMRHLYSDATQFYDDELSDQDQHPHGDYDVPDSAGSDQCDPINWFADGWCDNQQPPPSAPSPSLSSTSEFSSNSHCCSPVPLASRPRRPARSRRESLKIRKSVQSQFQDPESAKSDYYTLKDHITGIGSKSQLVTAVVCSRWTVIADAISCGDQALVHDALALIAELVSSRLIQVRELLFILQQGLLITLKDSLSRMGHHQVDIIKFLIIIAQVEPSTTPYLIEIMSNTGFLDMFVELVSMGTPEEIQMVAQFYSTMFEVLCDLAASDKFSPTVPNTIAAANSPQELARLYDPKTILKRIVQPHLLDPLVNWLFKQMGNIECDLFRTSLTFVANSINYITFRLRNVPTETEWARSLVSVFQGSQLDSLIERSFANGTMDQYPVSVGSEVKQFVGFYKQWSAEINTVI